MRVPGSTSDQLLSRIEREFSRYRRHQGGKRVHSPAHLKMLALSAIEAGVLKSRVAMAAGVSLGSICNWQKSRSSMRPALGPQELKLVAASVETPTLKKPEHHLLSESLTARIQLQSGVLLEVPVVALERDFLKVLNQLGGDPC